jgi:hypothetical protein
MRATMIMILIPIFTALLLSKEIEFSIPQVRGELLFGQAS